METIPLPPSHIQEFYNRIKTADKESLAREPFYIDPQAFVHGPPHPSLRLNVAKTVKLQESYTAVQAAFFDFTGRCMCCQLTHKHVHSIVFWGLQSWSWKDSLGFTFIPNY
jgi:hypothetical protein